MLVNTEIADCYQGLFNHLSGEHNLTLTITEMDEIIRHSLNAVGSINAKTKLDQKLFAIKGVAIQNLRVENMTKYVLYGKY